MGKVKLSVIILSGLILLGGCQSVTPALTTPATQPVSTPPASQTVTPATTDTSQAATPKPTTAAPPSPRPLPIGVSISNIAPDFHLQTLTGDNISLSDFRGKPVLLNFWATWCGPCRFEMPFLQQVNDSWSSKGLVVLAVDYGEKPAVIEKFMIELNLSMIVPMDTDGKVTKSYLIGGLPTTFLIDKDGVIRQKVVGAFPNAATIENELKKIMP